MLHTTCLDSVKKKEGNAEKMLSSISCTALMWLPGQASLLQTTEGACLADRTALSGAEQLLHNGKPWEQCLGGQCLYHTLIEMRVPRPGTVFWINILFLEEILIHWLHVLIKTTHSFLSRKHGFFKKYFLLWKYALKIACCSLQKVCRS